MRVLCEGVRTDELPDAGEDGSPGDSAEGKGERQENETFYVAFTNEKVRVYSYEDDGVVTALETWADGKAVLG